MAAVALSIGANAQDFSKGDWMLNASVSELNLDFSSSATSLNIGANAGYFISNKFAVEAQLGVDYTKLDNVDGATNFAFGAGVRYYPVSNLFARARYLGTKLEGVDDLSSSLGVAVGYDWFLSEKVFFEPALEYRRGLGDGGGNNLGLSLGIGVKF